MNSLPTSYCHCSSIFPSYPVHTSSSSSSFLEPIIMNLFFALVKATFSLRGFSTKSLLPLWNRNRITSLSVPWLRSMVSTSPSLRSIKFYFFKLLTIWWTRELYAEIMRIFFLSTPSSLKIEYILHVIMIWRNLFTLETLSFLSPIKFRAISWLTNHRGLFGSTSLRR